MVETGSKKVIKKVESHAKATDEESSASSSELSELSAI